MCNVHKMLLNEKYPECCYIPYSGRTIARGMFIQFKFSLHTHNILVAEKNQYLSTKKFNFNVDILCILM